MLFEPGFHRAAVWVEIGLALLTIATVARVRAPYGRYERAGWGPTLSSRTGWLLMESPAVLVFLAFYFTSADFAGAAPLGFFVLWQSHYLYRAWVYPFRLRVDGKRMPLLVALAAVAFNTLNGYVNAAQVAHFGDYPLEWLYDPRFLLGAVLFFGGLAANRHADSILFNLRGPGETGYKIPRGGLYRWVSSPNYLAEIIQWIGWAVATWSLAGLAFALYTIANLAPRAASNHVWYLERFPDYPRERRALIPGIW